MNDTIVNTNSTKEVDNMVKKAETLKSLDGLNMSKRTKTYLTNEFNSLDEIIWYGRNKSYIHTHFPETVKKSKKSTLELVSALDEAGYIRHDINPGSFCIGLLYQLVFNDKSDIVAMPANFNNFCETVEKVSCRDTIYHVDYRMGNEKYESFENPTNEQLDAVKRSLQACLAEKEYKILTYGLGFEDGYPHSLGQTGEHFCITRMRVRQIEAKALQKLKNMNILPTIIPSSDEQRAEIITIVKEIEELRKDPAVKRQVELTQRLFQISRMPFDCAGEAVKYLNSGILDFSDIDRLDLSVRAHNCLKRAGIDTIADIVKLPKEDWSKIRNLGHHAMKEVEEKVRAAGYADFSVEEILS